MEKRRILWTLVTAFAISLVIIAGSLTLSAQRETGHAQEAPVQTEATDPGYLMRIDGDTIALFRTGSETPYRRLDMPLSLLSEYDRELLTRGIEVRTQKELDQLVEDFTS